MSLFKLAYSNFKRSVKNYVALIISLSFSIFTFFNFQNIVFSNAMDVLKEKNSDYIAIIIQVISIVLIIFVFFFIWYATNVFLSQRKKEIGIFTFMGLDNVKIGKMYVIEVAMMVGDMSSFIYIFYAVVLVVAGIYFLYNGVIPFVIKKLAQNKSYLYQKERSLWVNNLAFRLKKNYRAYAMVTILMICSVTVLATSFAMKQRYDNISHFRGTYTYTVMANKALDGNQIAQKISSNNELNYHNSLNYIALNADMVKSKYLYNQYGVVSYSQLKKAAKEAKIKFDIPKLDDQQVVNLTRLYLLDISDPEINPVIEIAGEKYQIVDETATSYLGLLQENISTYIVSDNTYEKLRNFGQEFYMYNYQIKDPNNYQASIDYLNSLVKDGPVDYVSYLANDPNGGDIAWVRVMYSICIFLFLVFILASGSIIFMKLSNEAFEDRERYNVLKKLGISKRTLSRSIRNEIRFAYYCPFVLMVLSSYFSVHALANVMKTELYTVNIVSAIVILVIFYIIYTISVLMFKKKVLSDH